MSTHQPVPDANHDAYAQGGGPQQRISRLALAGLGCSVLCVPPLSTLGAMLGIGAVVRIGRSEGRLGGRSLAIAAIVLGLLASALWVGVGIGAGQFWSIASRAGTGFYTGLGAGDLKAARELLHPDASAAISDAELAAFADGSRAQAGVFAGAPRGLLAAVGDYLRSPLRSRIDEARPMGDAGLRPIALPLTFDGRTALLVVGLDADSFSKHDPIRGQVRSLLLLTESQQPGAGLWLARPGAAAPPAVAPAPTPPPAP